jgi:hypothetical protein
MADPNELNLQESLEAVLGTIRQIKEGEFSEQLGKVSVYLGLITKSWDAYNSALQSARQQTGADQDQYRRVFDARTGGLRSSIKNSVKFARMNLDLAMAQALDRLIPRPRSAVKSDELKRAASLQMWFDGLQDPTSAMLEHYKGSSIPLDKYLIAGQWGHEYLMKRRINPEDYDCKLCEVLQFPDSAARNVVLKYGRLARAIDTLEESAFRMLDALEDEVHAK